MEQDPWAEARVQAGAMALALAQPIPEAGLPADRVIAPDTPIYPILRPLWNKRKNSWNKSWP